MADDVQRAQWIAMRRRATGLLLFMVLLLLIAHQLQWQYAPGSPGESPTGLHVWSYVAAFAEAALVGGFADWFAVTALFRQPLGLPIPHTAILPTHKNRLANSMVSFIEHHFFTPDVVTHELRDMDFVAIAADWLRHPRQRRWLVRQIIRSVPSASSVLTDQDVRRSLWGVLGLLLTPKRLSRAAVALFNTMLSQQRHLLLFDRMLVVIDELLRQNEWLMYDKVVEKTPGWMPRYMKDEIFRRLIAGLNELLEDMRQPDSPWRDSFTASLQAQIEAMAEDEQLGRALHTYLRALFTEPTMAATASGGWASWMTGADAPAGAGRATLAERADAVVAALEAAWLRDTDRSAWLNRRLQAGLAQALIARRARILNVIRRVMHAWDGPTVAAAIESYVGRDLQYIRINGTLVGGTIGLVLHMLQNSF